MAPEDEEEDLPKLLGIEEPSELPGGAAPPDDDGWLEPPSLPSIPTMFDLTEELFWNIGDIPVGSVLAFKSPGRHMEEDAPLTAARVEAVTWYHHGAQVVPKLLGSSTKAEKAMMGKLVKDGIHLCYPVQGNCGQSGAPGLHLMRFKWYPPGDFEADWLSKAAKGVVMEGKKMAAAMYMGPGAGPSGPAQEAGERTEVENRLQAIKRRSALRVKFVAPGGGFSSSPAGAGAMAKSKAGQPGPLAVSRQLQGMTPPVVKKEAITVESSGDEAIRSDKKRPLRKLGAALAEAVASQHQKTLKDAAKKVRRSSSKERKKKKKKKKGSKSGSSESGDEEESSEDSMLPPLKKKSKKSPGSVFRLLENQAVEALSQDGVLEEGYAAGSSLDQRPKLHTYFQLALRPSLDPRSRDCKELGLVARALDLLRAGRLEELADLLAARMIAIDTATRQGWATARHLEVFGGDEVATVPPHILLSAQRYNRQVEKAGGKGSWNRAQNWQGTEWRQEPRPKGKGGDWKGKGRKGKGKQKNPWKDDAKEKEDPKPKT